MLCRRPQADCPEMKENLALSVDQGRQELLIQKQSAAASDGATLAPTTPIGPLTDSVTVILLTSTDNNFPAWTWRFSMLIDSRETFTHRICNLAFCRNQATGLCSDPPLNWTSVLETTNAKPLSLTISTPGCPPRSGLQIRKQNVEHMLT